VTDAAIVVATAACYSKGDVSSLILAKSGEGFCDHAPGGARWTFKKSGN
jgi:hypothetical protein